MPKLRIDIGAAVDASVATAYTSVVKGALSAANQIKRAFTAAGLEATRSAARAATAGEGPYRRVGNAAEDSAKKAGKAFKDLGQATGQMALGSAGRFKQLADGLKALPPDIRLVAKEAQKALAQIEREKARTQLGLGSSKGGGAGRNSLYWHPNSWLKVRKPTVETVHIDPLRTAGGAARTAGRFGMSSASFIGLAARGMAQSAGVETSFSNIAQKNFDEEDLAQKISNSGYLPGTKGPNGQIVDKGTLLSESRNVAVQTGMSRGDVLEGMQGFVGQTGDLQLARDVMKDMAVLSKAQTGTSFADMSNASAQVAMALGDVPDKGEKTLAVMRQIAGQGKLGAIEVRDLATQMAKIAAQAGKFQGGAAENIALLGVVAQEARAKGGATSAANATTAVARFTEEFAKSSVLKKLKKDGLNPFADAGQTQIKKAPDLIKAILSYTKGNLGKLSDVMPSSVAQKAIGGFAKVYNETKGTDAEKIAAVTAEFENLQRAQLTTEEVNRAFAESMKTAKSQAAVFNEKMAAATEQMQAALLPALVALTPAVLKLTGAVTSRITALADDTKSWQQKADALVNGAASFDSRFGTQVGATNTISSIRRWEDANIKTNNNLLEGRGGSGPGGEWTQADTDKNMRAAAPALGAEQAQEDKVKAQLAASEARLEQDKPHLYSTLRRSLDPYAATHDRKLSDDEIAERAKHGDQESTNYQGEKRGVDDLKDVLMKLQKERADLVTLLSSGSVIVQVSNLPTPPPGEGGAGSLPPKAHT